MFLTNGAANNQIGGIAAGVGNLIAFNTGVGVTISAGDTVRIACWAT